MIALLVAILMAFMPPCATEDSSNCGWDARRGNGGGHSFVDLNGWQLHQ